MAKEDFRAFRHYSSLSLCSYCKKILLTCTRWPKRSVSLCAASPSRCTKYFSPSPTIFTPVCVYFLTSTPRSVLASMTCFMQGISISTPSSPNLFSPGHFFARKFSNPMDLYCLVRKKYFLFNQKNIYGPRDPRQQQPLLVIVQLQRSWRL